MSNSFHGQINPGTHRKPLGERLVCPHVTQLEMFQSHRSVQAGPRVWINANELPYPVGDFALDLDECHRYAGPISSALADAFAAYAGVTTDCVIATRGADEAIELLVRAFCSSGRDVVVHCPPTYCLYRIAARVHDVEVFDAPLSTGFGLNHEALRRAPENTKVVFLCNPNNPTGNLFSPTELADVAEFFSDRALVVIDEAYIEFCPTSSMVPLLERFENLVVIRTLSKAFGLAGLHMGYAIADPTIIGALKRIIQPYPIPYPCAQIALQALSAPGLARVRHCTNEIIETRERFTRRLRSKACVRKVLPSQTNFVLAEFHDKMGAWQKLLQRGVVARQPETLESAIRFSIGTASEMDTVLAVLDESGSIDSRRFEVAVGGE